MKNLNFQGKYLLIFLLALFFIPAYSLFAVPANPKAFEIAQPDGKKITVRSKGDEHFSWQEDANGYVIKKDKADGFWKYAVPRKDEATFEVLPDSKVGHVNPKAKGLKKSDLPGKKLIQDKINSRKNNTVNEVAPLPAPAPANNIQVAPLQQSSSSPQPPIQKIPISGTTTVRNIVILACFADQWDPAANGGLGAVKSTALNAYGRPSAEYINLFNQAGYNADGAVGSVKDYYSEVSYGKVTMESVIVPWVKLPQNQAYYGGNDYWGNDAEPRQMVIDAINAAKAAGFDFSQGDKDGDGWVDCLTIIHSGYGEEWGGQDDCIWSHKWSLAAPVIKDSVKMYTYHTEPASRGYESDRFGEMTTIGVICHELGHFFGLPDLYDYSSTFGGLGEWCLMSNGSWNGAEGERPAHFSAWCKVALGFVNPKIVHDSSTPISIGQVFDNQDIHMLRDGCAIGEYFLIENRQQTGFDSAIPGDGILIYHVDSNSSNNDLGNWPHPVVKIEEADGNNTLGSSGAGQASDAWTNASALGDFKDWTGSVSSNSMKYQAADYFLRSNIPSYYTYNTLSNFSFSAPTMTYEISTVVPTLDDMADNTTGSYTVSWSPSQNADDYEIQEGLGGQTSFFDGAQDVDAMWENWSIGGQVLIGSTGRSSSSSYYFTSYDGTKWYSSVSSMTMRDSFKLTSNINLSYYFMCDSESSNGYLKLQASSDDGVTWKTLWTHIGGLVSSWQAVVKNTASFTSLGFVLDDAIKIRFVMDVENPAGSNGFPAFGWAVDDISITNTLCNSFNGSTIGTTGGATSYNISGKTSGSYQYRVRAHANTFWQKWSSPKTVNVNIPGPRIALEGNSVPIKNGDITPSASDDTDFGSVTFGTSRTRTFTIYNNGTLDLNLTGTSKVDISGTNASQFVVTSPPPSPIAALDGKTFQITFTPADSGTKTATVSIISDDPTKPNFYFSIKGSGNSPGVFQLTAASPSCYEYSGLQRITVRRDIGKDGSASVDVYITDITATHAADYTVSAGAGLVTYDAVNSRYKVTLSWADQVSTSKYFDINVVEDDLIEGDETASITLNNPVGAALGAQSSAEFTIIDNDYLLEIHPLVAEGGNGVASAVPVSSSSDTTTADISAVPDANYHFVNWTAVGPVTFTNANSANTKIAYKGSSIVTANFAHDSVALTMAVAGEGAATATPVSGPAIVAPASGNTDNVTAISLEAIPDGGSSFAGWSVIGNATIDDTEDPTTNLTLTGEDGSAVTVTANFIVGSATVLPLVAGEATEPGITDSTVGGIKIYKVTVDPGNSLLEVTTSGNGDCDLYVRYAAAPTLSTYDKRSTGVGASEKVRIEDPTPGTWYIMLHAYAAYDTVSLDVKVGDFAIGQPGPITVTPSTAKVQLDWPAVAAGSPTAYEIYRAELDEIEVATKIAEVDAADPLTYDDVFTAATPNYDYYYWVRAVTATDEGKFSESAHATLTDGLFTLLVSGTEKKLISGAAGSIQIFKIKVPAAQTLLEIKIKGLVGDCDFDVVAPNGDTVKRGVKGSSNELVQITGNPLATDFWTIHLYGKTAYSGLGLMAKYSKLIAVPAAPVVSASDGMFDDRILLNWKTVPGATRYEVFRNKTKLPPDPINDKIAEVADITYEDNSKEVIVDDIPGTLFYYFVTAKNTVGTSKPSASNSGFIMKAPLLTPAAPLASDGIYFDRINVKWTKVIGATSYQVYRTETLTAPLIGVDTPAGETTALFLDDFAKDFVPQAGGVLNVNNYYYWIAAKNQNGTSPISKVNSGFLSKKGPATITASNGTYSDRVVVTWAAVPGATAYDVYRCTDIKFILGPSTVGNAVEGLEFEDVPPVSDTVYYYKVKAKYNAKYDSNFCLGTAIGKMTTGASSPTVELALDNNTDSGSITDKLKGSSLYYSVDVPYGTTRIVATLSGTPPPVGTTNDCDLFAKFANFPTKASYSAKGIENLVAKTEILTVSNPAAGTWYFLLYGTMAYSNVTLTVKCYATTDILLTTVPSNDLEVPFTAAFKGKVVDETGTGIPNMLLQARNPITGLTTPLVKTDAKGCFAYSALINSEGEHTFDFFFNTMPDTAKGTASHTVATKKGCLDTVNNFFDLSGYIPAKPVVVADHADVRGLQNFLDIRNGWNTADTVAPGDAYENMWINSTIVQAKDDAQLTGKLNEGLYMFFYGVEGAGVGNDTDKTPKSAFSAVPYVVHVSSDKRDIVLGNLKLNGIIDETQYNDIILNGKIGVVAVAAISNPVEGAVEGDCTISMLACEQLEILVGLAEGSVPTADADKYSGTLTRKGTVTLPGSDRKINVLTSAFVK
ncbi:MAG: hypothetical protein A2X45_15440 [Lentisphaerae bacterium GWF2_50_93]|nr:MAG: hypothetical protein A2X45_15440 [Lentisphaerae bacterium GWF2_50_93]